MASLSDAPADTPRQPKLLERLRIHLRTRHYSIRTEEAYIDWARRFILFHSKRHPQEMGAAEVEAFLSHLAVDRQVSASTQNQAKAAILYLYKQVLGMELPWLDEVVQARRPRRLPVVLTPGEVRELLLHAEGTAGLVAQVLYGTGMRLMEALRLRVKEPLAERLRPQTLGEVIGQAHLLGPGKPLRVAFESGRIHSMILWGPPGVGKTTLARLVATAVSARFIVLSAVLAGVKDIRDAVDQARAAAAASGQGTIVFVDEVHRFNKASRTPSCRMWNRACSPSSAPPPRTPVVRGQLGAAQPGHGACAEGAG
jgi:hypothetical protein